MRPGRLDRKIEIPLPNEQARMEILKIHAANITKHGDIDYEAVVKLAENFNGADLRNVCTEAGMFAIRDERDYIVQVRPCSCPLGPLHRACAHVAHDRNTLPCCAGGHDEGRPEAGALGFAEHGVTIACNICHHVLKHACIHCSQNEAKKLETNLTYDQSFGEGKG